MPKACKIPDLQEDATLERARLAGLARRIAAPVPVAWVALRAWLVGRRSDLRATAHRTKFR